jgi:kexin
VEVHDVEALVSVQRAPKKCLRADESLILSRGEDPVGTWKIKVKDAVNVEQVGRFKAWSLQLWGSAVDAAAAKPWTLPTDGQPDEEQTGSKQHSKPTDNLPGDHGTAEGEADKPGLTKPQETGSGEDIAEPTETGGVSAGVDDEGFFDNIMSLTTSSTWIFGAAGFILLAAATATGFFIIRTRGRRRKLFDQLNGGERGAYEPVGEDVQMGLLSRGRQKLMGGDEGVSGTSKVLYDAFAEGESEDEDYEEADEASALKYHDDFLEDEGEENARAGATGEYDEEEGSRTPRPDQHDP